jgi:hypothetical protein
MDQQQVNDLVEWYASRKCSPPSPHFVKQQVLLRHNIPDCQWIETGTYYGTTAQFLAQICNHVHTIEPPAELAQAAKENCRNFNNITFHFGASEDKLEPIVSSIVGNCCFWLDGHYSAGNTFHGEVGSPIRHELKIIARHINKLGKVVVLIDDIRCSHLDKYNYPSLNYYVNWAGANGLDWIIEHDIFVAKTDGIAMY